MADSSRRRRRQRNANRRYNRNFHHVRKKRISSNTLQGRRRNDTKTYIRRIEKTRKQGAERKSTRKIGRVNKQNDFYTIRDERDDITRSICSVQRSKVRREFFGFLNGKGAGRQPNEKHNNRFTISTMCRRKS